MTANSVPLAVILTHTPFWVWAVLLLLIWRGLSAAQDRDVTAKRLVILPLVILYLAVSGILTSAASPLGLAAVVAGIVLGILAGMARHAATGAHQIAPGVVRLHGEWVTLFVVLAIFLLHYATGVLTAMDAPLSKTLAYRVGMGGLSAFLSTMTVTVAVLRIRLALAPMDRTAEVS